MPTKTCEHCGAEYPVRKSKLATSRFCSKPCQYAWRQNLRVSPEERYWQRVVVRPDGQCWGWAGCVNTRGYPVIWEGGGRNRRLRAGHRLSWGIHFGPIPDGMHICHKCDNPTCTNPQHLFLGTPRDNAVDMIHKGRAFKPKLTPDQVREIRRDSRTCAAIARDYGVDESTIAAIKRRAIWRSVA